MARCIMSRMLAMVVAACLLSVVMGQQQAVGYLSALQMAGAQHQVMLNVVNKMPQYKMLMQSAAIPLTVFAPTDAAFKSASKKFGLTVDAAVANSNLMNNVLTYHVCPKYYPKAALTNGLKLTTMKGGKTVSISISKDTGKYYVKGVGSTAQIVKFDQIVLSPGLTRKPMGVIHDIANVLLPSKDVQGLINGSVS